MPPGASSPPTATHHLARKLFLAVILVSLLPLAAALILAYVFTGADLVQLTLIDRQYLVLGLVLAGFTTAGLIWWVIHRVERRITHLLTTLRLFTGGKSDRLAVVSGRDEIAELAVQFNLLAGEINEARHLGITHSDGTLGEGGQRPVAALVAQTALIAANLDDFLKSALELYVRHYGCTFGVIYLIESSNASGKSCAVLAASAGTLGEDARALQKRYAERRVYLDQPPRPDWLVGRAFATRRPQMNPAGDSSPYYEAALPLLQPTHDGPRLVGAVDLLAPTGSDDSRRGLFSIRTVAEMQTAADVIALAAASFLTPTVPGTASPGPDHPFPPDGFPVSDLHRSPLSPGLDQPVATTPGIALRLDARAIFAAGTRIAQADTKQAVLEAAGSALRLAPYASAILTRPADPDRRERVTMPVTVCRWTPSRPPGQDEETIELDGPQLAAAEDFFLQTGGTPLLLYELDHPETDRENSIVPSELIVMARKMGCRSAACLPAMRDGCLHAILILGAAPDVPNPLFRGEGLDPFANLIQLTAAALDRIHTHQVTGRKLADLQTLWEFTAAISTETDLKTLLRRLHARIEAVLGQLNSFAVGLYDPEINLVSLPYMVEAGQMLQVPEFPVGAGFTSEVIRSRKPLLLSTAGEVQAESLRLGAFQVGDPARSWLGVPMLSGGEVVGLIIVQDTVQDGRFKPEDARLLAALASQVGVVIRNARLFEASRRQARQERVANAISDRIRRSVDLQSILRTTTDELGLALGARRATIRIHPSIPGAPDSTPAPESAPIETISSAKGSLEEGQ